MRRRQPSRPGLSYFDANSGRLITEGPDVLEVKAEIEARWPDVLSVFFDVEAEEWVIVEHCKDGTDRLVMTCKALNMRVVEKLDRIDQAKHVQGDLNRKYELEDDMAEKEKDHKFSEAIGDSIERFEHALMGSGVLKFNKMIVANGKYIKPGKKTVKAG